MLQMEVGTLVTRMDVLNRTNLTKLAISLNDDFLKSRGHDKNPSDVVFFFNRAALLFFRAGRFDDAVELSWRAIHFCMRCAAKDVHALGKALQPYVNIGRVRAVRGETEQAVKIFREIYNFIEAGESFFLGPYQFSKAEQEFILVHDAPLLAICRNMFLAESLRALLLAKDYPRVLAFVDELKALEVFRDPASVCTLLEVQALANIEIGDLARASAALDRLVDLMNASGAQYPAIYFLLSRLLAARGLRKEAISAIDAGKLCLQRVVERSGAKLTRDVTQTRYLLALAEYLYGSSEQALPILDVVRREAAQLDDEVLELKAQFLLTKIALEKVDRTMTGRKKEEMISALSRAIQGSDYQFQRQMIQEYLEKELQGSGYLRLHQQLEFEPAGIGSHLFIPKCEAQLNQLRNNLFAYVEEPDSPGRTQAAS